MQPVIMRNSVLEELTVGGHPGGNLLQSGLAVGDSRESKLRGWNEKTVPTVISR